MESSRMTGGASVFQQSTKINATIDLESNVPGSRGELTKRKHDMMKSPFTKAQKKKIDLEK